MLRIVLAMFRGRTAFTAFLACFALVGCAKSPPAANTFDAFEAGAGVFGLLPEENVRAELASAVALYRIKAQHWPITLSDLRSVEVTTTQSATALHTELNSLASFACLPRDDHRALLVVQTRQPGKTYVFRLDFAETSDARLQITLRSAGERSVAEYFVSLSTIHVALKPTP